MRTMTDDVRRYLSAVETELSDLDAEDRAELLGDVEEHLTEVAAEYEGALEERLGSPSAYASELRASAGFAARAPADRTDPWWSRVLSDDQIRWVRELVSEVEPGWWVLRGYLAVLVLSILVFRAHLADIPIPRAFGQLWVGAIVIAIAIAASLALGRVGRRSRMAAIASAVASALVVLTALVALSEAKVRIGMRADADVVPAPPGARHIDGTEVLNICPYSADGKPLSRVLLYDRDGRPITALAGPQPSLSDGVMNSYPRGVDGAARCPKLAAVSITTTGGESWIEAMVGGDTVHRALVGPGRTLTFHGPKVYLVVGNSGAVDVRVNGRSLGKPGTTGQVYRATFGAETTTFPPSEAETP